MRAYGAGGGAVITPDPPSVVAARQLAEEAHLRRPHLRRRRVRPLKLQPLADRHLRG